jgi:hypothetical protein
MTLNAVRFGQTSPNFGCSWGGSPEFASAQKLNISDQDMKVDLKAEPPQPKLNFLA